MLTDPRSDVTRQDSQLTLTVYDRASVDNYYLGTVQIKPILKHDHTVDQWYKLHGLQDDRGVTGEMRVQITFSQNKVSLALSIQPIPSR
jgi:serine/threonine protein kinase SCH9